MDHQHLTIGSRNMAVISCNTIIVGSGAAGYNAADRLFSFGQTDIAIVTEGINCGTSRNTGSDKQTYYKLTLAGQGSDSVGEMARTLFSGQCVDGDIALAEAALSAQCFLKLADLGVPFPTNRFGEYVVNKTDHDPRQRATSVGPLTSKQMTEALEKAVLAKNIPIFDQCQVVAILTSDSQARGLLCLNLAVPEDPDRQFLVFNCRNIIYATGGPAGMYADSVYPLGHYGASGLAFAAGVAGRNLTEWQYGLASVQPRWNVSGTYMQVLPRLISRDRQGGDEREFLADFFKDQGDCLTKVFLKGYEWPFDVRKVAAGSSIIDLLVYIESCLKGRRVWLDYRTNPGGGTIDYASLSPEAQQYLERAGAAFGTPFERLVHMNAPAVDFYRSKGVDLAVEPLEIALCAQHNNGGLGIDLWWQTNLTGFFAVGEAAASHGVYRPGGSALNAGQVGSTRAARLISRNRQGSPAAPANLLSDCAGQIAAVIRQAESAVNRPDTIDDLRQKAQAEMSRVGAAIRDVDAIRNLMTVVRQQLDHYAELAGIGTADRLGQYFRLQDILTCQYVYLAAMADYAAQGGMSRGSALYSSPDGNKPHDGLPEIFRFNLDDGSRGDLIQETVLDGSQCQFNWRPVHPIPVEDDFFENVWRQYRETGNVF